MEVKQPNLQFDQYFTIEKINVKGVGKSNISIINDILLINAIYNDSYIRIPINNLDFILYSKGNLFVSSKIFLGIVGDQFELSKRGNSHVFKNLYDNIVGIRKHINNQFSPNSTHMSMLNNNTMFNASDEISKYHNLFKQGAITKEEFEGKKKELLNINLGEKYEN